MASYTVTAQPKNPASIPNYLPDGYFGPILCGHKHQTEAAAVQCKTKLEHSRNSNWKWKSPSYAVSVTTRFLAIASRS
jgi:hypothetical protein